MKFFEHSEGGKTLFMVAGDDALEAMKRVAGVGASAGVNYYDKTTVIIVKDADAEDVRNELSAE